MPEIPKSKFDGQGFTFSKLDLSGGDIDASMKAQAERAKGIMLQRGLPCQLCYEEPGFDCLQLAIRLGSEFAFEFLVVNIPICKTCHEKGAEACRPKIEERIMHAIRLVQISDPNWN